MNSFSLLTSGSRLVHKGYGYIHVEADDALMALLKQKAESKETTHDIEINAGLVKVLLAPPAQ